MTIDIIETEDKPLTEEEILEILEVIFKE